MQFRFRGSPEWLDDIVDIFAMLGVLSIFVLIIVACAIGALSMIRVSIGF